MSYWVKEKASKGKRYERIFNNFNHTLWSVLHSKCPGRIVKYTNSFPKALGNKFGNRVSQTQTIHFFMFLSCLIVTSRQKKKNIQHVYTASIWTARRFNARAGVLRCRMDRLLEFHATSRHHGENQARLRYFHTRPGCHWLCERQQPDNKNLNFYLRFTSGHATKIAPNAKTSKTLRLLFTWPVSTQGKLLE